MQPPAFQWPSLEYLRNRPIRLSWARTTAAVPTSWNPILSVTPSPSLQPTTPTATCCGTRSKVCCVAFFFFLVMFFKFGIICWCFDRLTDGNIGDKFAMQTTGNGKVYVAQPLDWEQQSSYLLNISITDGHNTIYTQVSIRSFTLPLEWRVTVVI